MTGEAGATIDEKGQQESLAHRLYTRPAASSIPNVGYAAAYGAPEHVEVCVAAQGKFLRNHLGRWISLFDRSVASNGVEPYLELAHFTDTFVRHHARQLGAPVEATTTQAPVKHTPFDPDFSCAGCAVAEFELSRR